MRVLSINPRPEDKLLACPATTAALQRAGHSIQFADAADIRSAPEFDLCLGPSPQSQDILHEKTGREIRSLISERGGVWWEWSLWTRLRRPTLLYFFGEAEMNNLRKELHRLRDQKMYERLVRGRGWAVAISVSRFLWESSPDNTYAEEMHESICKNGSWRLGEYRRLDPLNPLGGNKERVE